MKVLAWYSDGFAPLAQPKNEELVALSFLDEDGRPSDRLLLSGISGTGKSRLMGGMVQLFCALSQWAQGKQVQGLSGQAAVLLEGLWDEPLLAIWATKAGFWDRVTALHPQTLALGLRGAEILGFSTDIRRGLSNDAGPNMLLLSHTKPGGLLSPWGMAMEDVRDHVRAVGGMAQALAALGRQNPKKLDTLMDQTNCLLSGKRLIQENGEISVRINNGRAHPLEDLSYGEEHVLWLLYAAAYALHDGGILLVDEPDVHLHPSQITALLTTLENLALPHEGQMILTSHGPEVWRRYQNLGVRVTLEATP